MTKKKDNQLTTEYNKHIKEHMDAYNNYHNKFAKAVLAHFGEHYRIREEDPFYTPTEIS